MRASKSELAEDIATEGLNVRGADWGEMHVNWETHRDSHDLTPVFKGLPEDLCSTPHWGYVIRGGFLARYKDGSEERMRAGDVYHLSGAHTVITDPGTELIEFSPREAMERMFEAIQGNIERWLKDQK